MRLLCHFITASLITLCCIPAQTSIRRCLKSSTFCTFVWTRWCPRFCNQLDWGRGGWATTNLTRWMQLGVMLSRRLIVSHALCAGALSCWTIKNSLGSVATHLRCGGIFNECFIANFLLSSTVKEFRKFLKINTWRSYSVSYLTHGVVAFLIRVHRHRGSIHVYDVCESSWRLQVYCV